MPVTDQFSKRMLERLLGCNPLVWNHRIFTWDSQQPDISSDAAGPEFAKIFHILSYVSVYPS